MMQITPDYMHSLCRDWGLWLSCGKHWPCSGLGYPQGRQFVKPATTRAQLRSESLYKDLQKIDKHKIHEMFAPIQKTSNVKRAKSREPGILWADREVERLDDLIKQMEWPKRLVIMHTYGKAGGRRTTREVAPLIAASHTTVADELNAGINWLVERFTKNQK